MFSNGSVKLFPSKLLIFVQSYRRKEVWLMWIVVEVIPHLIGYITYPQYLTVDKQTTFTFSGKQAAKPYREAKNQIQPSMLFCLIVGKAIALFISSNSCISGSRPPSSSPGSFSISCSGKDPCRCWGRLCWEQQRQRAVREFQQRTTMVKGKTSQVVLNAKV